MATADNANFLLIFFLFDKGFLREGKELQIEGKNYRRKRKTRITDSVTLFYA